MSPNLNRGVNINRFPSSITEASAAMEKEDWSDDQEDDEESDINDEEEDSDFSWSS